MAKDLTVSMLLDFYGELLTEKQRSALDGYYNQDMSLAEIAEEMCISRQGVRAVIKQGEAHLTEFEEKLGMAARFAGISGLAEDIRCLTGQLPECAVTQKILCKVDEITNNL